MLLSHKVSNSIFDSRANITIEQDLILSTILGLRHDPGLCNS